MKELDKSKLILLPSGNTLKWTIKSNLWIDHVGSFGFKESDLRFFFGDTIQQIEPRWYDGLDITGWTAVGRTINRQGWSICDDGVTVKSSDAYKFPTPTKAIEVINALIEAEQ